MQAAEYLFGNCRHITWAVGMSHQNVGRALAFFESSANLLRIKINANRVEVEVFTRQIGLEIFDVFVHVYLQFRHVVVWVGVIER